MPLIAHSNLPTFKKLKDEGEQILSITQAKNQDIREIHIGFVNLMPELAIEATERQFFRLIGGANQITQIFIHPIYLDSLDYSQKALNYLKQYYQSFDQIKNQGLDALIITGANVVDNTDGTLDKIKQGIFEVIELTQNRVISTLLSCFASHIVLEKQYGIKKNLLPEKFWGVFDHQLSHEKNPLLRGINNKLHIPHSRFNRIKTEQMLKYDLKILIECEYDFHLATSKDGIKYIFMQGHPEYDTISLLKEYKREIQNYCNQEIIDFPVFPKNYFSYKQQVLLDEYCYNLQKGTMSIEDFPEEWLTKGLSNNWRDSAFAFYNNWLGCVYRLTNFDPLKNYMDDIDTQNPLGLDDF